MKKKKETLIYSQDHVQTCRLWRHDGVWRYSALCNSTICNLPICFVLCSCVVALGPMFPATRRPMPNSACMTWQTIAYSCTYDCCSQLIAHPDAKHMIGWQVLDQHSKAPLPRNGYEGNCSLIEAVSQEQHHCYHASNSEMRPDPRILW